MTEPYMGVIIEQRAGGNITVVFSDPNYKHPEIQSATIWEAIASILEHFFTVHAEIVVMAKGETENVHYLPKKIEDKNDKDNCERAQDKSEH